MFPQRFDLRGMALIATLAAALVAPAAARAQDSFARVTDAGTGRPVLSVLGTGIGMPFASLSLEMRCPAAGAWTVAVTGVRAPSGTVVAAGFGDPGGGWAPIRVEPLRYEDSSLSLALNRSSFRAALTQARADYPEARDAELRLVIGDAVGLAVNRDALVREMTDFARNCAAAGAAPVQASRAQPVRPISYTR